MGKKKTSSKSGDKPSIKSNADQSKSEKVKESDANSRTDVTATAPGAEKKSKKKPQTIVEESSTKMAKNDPNGSNATKKKSKNESKSVKFRPVEEKPRGAYAYIVWISILVSLAGIGTYFYLNQEQGLEFYEIARAKALEVYDMVKAKLDSGEERKEIKYDSEPVDLEDERFQESNRDFDENEDESIEGRSDLPGDDFQEDVGDEEETEVPKVSPEVVHKIKPEVTPEVVQEIEPEVTPEVVQEIEPEVTPEVVQEIEPEVTPKVVKEIEPEVTPEVLQEIELEVTPEVIPEVVQEIKPEVIPEVTSEVVHQTEPEVTPEVVLDVTPEAVNEAAPEVADDAVVAEIEPEVTLEIAPDVVPEVSPEVVPEVTTEVVPEVATEVVPEVATKVVQEVTTEDVPEVATEVVPEVATEVVPEVVPEIATQAPEIVKEAVPSEATTEVVPEVVTEVVPEVTPEVVPEVAPEVVPEVATEVVPEVATDVVPEVKTEIVPEVASEVTPEVEPEVVPEVVPEVTPEVVSEVVPEVAPEVVPEVASEVVPEVASEVVPEVASEVVPEVASEVVPEVVPEVVAEVASEVVPEVVPEVVAEVASEVVPEVASEVVPEVVPEMASEVVPEVEPEVVSKISETTAEVASEAAPEVVPAGGEVPSEQSSDVVLDLGDLDEKIDQNARDVVHFYHNVLLTNLNNHQAWYAKARALTRVAVDEKDSAIMDQAVEHFLKVLSPSAPKDVLHAAANQAAHLLRTTGRGDLADKTLKSLLEFYPEDITILNELGLHYLKMGIFSDAQQRFEQVLGHDPRNVFAKLYLGYLAKVHEKNLAKAVELMKDDILEGDAEVSDPRLYLELGDALARMNHQDEARKVYQKAVEKKFLPSVWQRSTFNVAGLTARAWWKLDQLGNIGQNFQDLEKNWEAIKDEAIDVFITESRLFLVEKDDVVEKGDYRHLPLFTYGKKNDLNCEHVPKTCSLVEGITDAAGCKHCEVKITLIQPGTHLWPHSGPTNCRLRTQLGLVVGGENRIRVRNEIRKWTAGKFIVYDDSFEHEISAENNSYRLILSIDMWHPDLSTEQKNSIVSL